jgi:DNA-binding CsgD family transcriptional regulator
VLAFVARRLESDPVALVMTVRDGAEVDRLLAAAALPQLALEPLEPADARTLLDHVAPGLTSALGDRVLAESAGNPLGLVELGGLVARSGGAALSPTELPLSTRVEQTFTGMVAQMPAVTRALLLVAALDDGDDLDEVLAATAQLQGEPVTADDVEPAVAGRLISVHEQYRLRFRHPLLRSALRQSATVAQRRRVHDCLAAVVTADDRRLWHLAAAATGPDEALAGELAAVATRARDRQAGAIALTAMERAALLSEDPQERGSRLLWAVGMAGDHGDIESIRRLLALVDETTLRPADWFWLTWYREVYLETGWTGNGRLEVYTELIDSIRSRPSYALQARLALGFAEALRGDGPTAVEIAELGERVLLAAGMHPMLSLTQRIRGVTALAEGRPDEAFRELLRVFDPTDVAYHPYVRFTLVGHLAEAATYSGSLDQVRAVVAELTPIAAVTRSPVLKAGLVYAGAVLADDAESYDAALTADLRDWPFERARVQLAYGGWLRRQRQAVESRPLLRAAAGTFDALGAVPWAERARAELRATGESRRKPIAAMDALTPQEQQIAGLAAEGLSNREIAERLFLSPRTVTTHLYRLFPKVGVKSRSELAAVLNEKPR